MTNIPQSASGGPGISKMPTTTIARTGTVLTGGGVVASLAVFVSASCCVLPMIFVSAGLGGAWLALLGTLFNYRFVLMAVALLAVGAGWVVLAIRRTRLQNACAHGLCSRPTTSRRAIIALSLATIFILGAVSILIYQDTVTRFVFQNRSLWS